jgi:hypothetical protein
VATGGGGEATGAPLSANLRPVELAPWERVRPNGLAGVPVSNVPEPSTLLLLGSGLLGLIGLRRAKMPPRDRHHGLAARVALSAAQPGFKIKDEPCSVAAVAVRERTGGISRSRGRTRWT